MSSSSSDRVRVPSRQPAPTSRGAAVSDVAPLALVAVFVAGILVSHSLGGLVQPVFLVGLLVTTLLLPLARWLVADADIALFLLVPTLLSATQNVFLLSVAASISQGQLQFVIVLNFLYALALSVALLGLAPAPDRPDTRRLLSWIVRCAVGLTLYGGVTVVLFHASPSAAVAAYRNLVTPLLFIVIGLLAATTTPAARYLGCLVALGLVTVAFGAYEFSVPGFWQSTHLADLWAKKGIAIASSTGLPSNFYSSEQFDGALARRMASSFADPVNFGTFLFVCFLAAWALRRHLAAALFVAASILAISKGALLGFLVFLMLWSRMHTPRVVHWAIVVATTVAGVAFYLFTLENSTGSTTAHVDGFTAAFAELPQHPLGRGLGNVGVLAGLFGGDGDASGIQESGLGVVVGQLGAVGLLGYGAFFAALTRASLKIEDTRMRLLALGILSGFVLNMMFNEVALSPNSAAPYFVALGLVLGRESTVRSNHIPDVKGGILKE